MGLGLVVACVILLALVLLFIFLWARKHLAGLFGGKSASSQPGVKVVRV